MTATRIAFGPFELDPDRGTLLRDGAPLAVGQRAAAVLAALAAAEGRTVGKSELLAPGLARRHRRGRQPDRPDGGAAQGDGADAGRARLDRDGAARGLPAGGAGRPRRRRGRAPSQPALAVLPFQVLGGAEGEGYFADGVAEDIIAALGRFRSFTVLSGSTSFLFRDRGATRARWRASSACATCCAAASAGPASGCGSPPSSSTAPTARTSGPRATTAPSPRSSRSRTASPRASPR